MGLCIIRGANAVVMIALCATSLVFIAVISSSTETFSSATFNNPQPFRLRSKSAESISSLRRSASKTQMQMPNPPAFFYGTAWKKERTRELVELAITSGFRAIDTACQPKHYNEEGVGNALKAAYARGIVQRSDIFLQTKFTSLNGQDPNNIPYDRLAPIREQVLQSFERSRQNLATDYLDCLVLHSPMSTFEDTLELWRVLEQIHGTGGTRAIGISNIYDPRLLKRLFDAAHVKPSVVQNRFYRDSGYDKEIRTFCRERGIMYQSFWTLTANPHILASTPVKTLCQKYNKTPAQIFFSVVRLLGISILTGTASSEHMIQDLETVNIALSNDEVSSVEQLLK